MPARIIGCWNCFGLLGTVVSFRLSWQSESVGHPEWNRHVKYEAIKKGYVTVYRTKYRQRVIRSLRLTPLGLEYIAKKDSTVFPFVMAQQDTNSGSRNITERILRYHAQATALIMARNAGAVFLPGENQACWPIHWPAPRRMIPGRSIIILSRSSEQQFRNLAAVRIRASRRWPSPPGSWASSSADDTAIAYTIPATPECTGLPELRRTWLQR